MASQIAQILLAQWVEGSGVKTLNLADLDIRDVAVTATNGAIMIITSTIRDMVVDNRLLVVNTADINELTGGDIAPGYVKTLNIQFTYNVSETVVILQQTFTQFAEFQVVFDAFQEEFDEQFKKFEDRVIQFEEFQALFDIFQVQFDEQVAQFAEFQLKFDKTVALFVEYQVKVDETIALFVDFQVKFDETVALFVDYQVKFDGIVVQFAEIQLKIDNALLRINFIEQTEIVALKKKNFDQDILLAGIMQTLFVIQEMMNMDP
jgi:hypothetical protein